MSDPSRDTANHRNSPTPLGLSPSFGFGDRLGLATPGHIEAMRREGGGIAPIYPQQSIREMTRTGRDAPGVMRDAMRAVASEGWTGPVGADADHLKTPDDVRVTADAGFTFFTIDPSDDVDRDADTDDESTLRKKLDDVRDDCPWLDGYRGRTVDLPTGTDVEFNDAVLTRAAVKYGRAIKRAVELGRVIRDTCRSRGLEYEIELSVDETDHPTTPAEHYIVADQCLRSGMRLVSLAPRFIGDLEKGVDYKGDVDTLERSLRDHAAIAARLGPYKLSLHSGSDKLSMYRALSRATEGRFHVKTAGTSYLEALRVVLRHDEPLFREIVRFSRQRYPTDRATYHVSATVAGVPDEADLDAVTLEQRYLERWGDVPEGRGFTEPGRQILHCTFGSVLTHDRFGPAVRDVLTTHPDTHREILADHFGRHLRALR